MTASHTLAGCSIVLLVFAWSARAEGSEGGRAEILVRDGPEPEVRYASGEAVYAEALSEGRWVGRSWSARGATDAPGFRRPEPAFRIEVRESPDREPRSLAGGWKWVSAEELPAGPRGGRRLRVVLSSEDPPLALEVHTVLDGTGVFVRWLEISNRSERPLALTAIAPWAGRLWEEDGPATLGCSAVRSDQRTGSFVWRALEPGLTVVETASEPCYDDPYFVVRRESSGEHFFGQLAWPSLYRMEFAKGGGLTFSIGPLAVGGALRVIAPGETVATPAVHLGHSRGDFDAAVQAMHEHIRRSVLPPRRPGRSYLIQYVANGDTGRCLYKGDDFNERNLRACVDVAAAVGAELFLIDGPFWAEKKRRQGLGGESEQGGESGEGEDDWDDWNWLQSSRKRFPSGLKALGDYARAKGLLFGAYARTEGRGMLESGGPDMAEVVSAMIEAHGLDLYRHDTSSNQWSDWVHSKRRDGFDECILWRHYEAFYKSAERIRERFPDVILQQAAAGGSRSDLATAARWHESFQSDLTTVPLIYQMAAGFSVYLPPEVLQSAYHGMWDETAPDRVTSLRCTYALGNVPCIYWTQLPGSVAEIKPEELAEWRRYAEIYKTWIRPLLPRAKVFHHAPVNARGGWDSAVWLAMEFASPDRTRGWATIVRFPGNRDSRYLLRPKGLDPERRYKVTFDNTRETRVLDGSSLIRNGLELEVPAEPASELVFFEASG